MESLDIESSNNMDVDSGSPIPTSSTSRKTSHHRDQGGLSYTLSVIVTHLRPFLPFFLISFLVAMLIYLLQAIVYGGPFTDPQFFIKFEKRWPPPNHQPTPKESARGSSGFL